MYEIFLKIQIWANWAIFTPNWAQNITFLYLKNWSKDSFFLKLWTMMMKQQHQYEKVIDMNPPPPKKKQEKRKEKEKRKNGLGQMGYFYLNFGPK